MNVLTNEQFLNTFEHLKGIIDEKNKNLIDSGYVKNIILELRESLTIAQVPIIRATIRIYICI